MSDLIQKIEANVELIIFIIFIFSIGLALVEFIWELYKKKINTWRLGEMWASLSVFLVAQLLEKSTSAIFIGAFLITGSLIPWEIPINTWTVLLCLVLVDFVYYWEHVIEHRVRILWTYHSIHHSSPIYNYTTAMRVSFIDNLITWIFYLPLILVGFNAYIVLICFFLVLVYQFWLHTEIIGKLGWFEKVFMTPSQHRVHHGSDPEYLDKNFGALFSIWDRLFGTYQEEKQRPTYGLTKPINTINPIKIHLSEFQNIYKDLKKSRSFKDALGYLTNAPGWKPQKPHSDDS